jgi:2-oxoglutarate dehydrogenase E2 component (dihydrolipoamide succinyltransferase)
MGIEVKVPALGESITEATLGAWLKKPGDAVAADEPVASLETDKVSVDVPSPVAGVFGEALVAEGDTVNVGAVIATIGEGAGSTPANAGQQSPSSSHSEPQKTEGIAPPPAQGNKEVTDEQAQALRLSPSVRRAVQESGVDPAGLTGTGKDGRITKEDVAKARSSPAEGGAQSSSQQKADGTGPMAAQGNRSEERVKMTRLRATIATRLKEAQNTAALLTTFNDVDMSEVIAARARYKICSRRSTASGLASWASS